MICPHCRAILADLRATECPVCKSAVFPRQAHPTHGNRAIALALVLGVFFGVCWLVFPGWIRPTLAPRMPANTFGVCLGLGLVGGAATAFPSRRLGGALAFAAVLLAVGVGWTFAMGGGDDSTGIAVGAPLSIVGAFGYLVGRLARLTLGPPFGRDAER